MTYLEIVNRAKEILEGTPISHFGEERCAVQVNIKGEGHGAFYVEAKDGKVSVEPYEYYDRDAIIEMDSSVFTKTADGSSKLTQAIADGNVNVYGDSEKARLVAIAFDNRAVTYLCIETDTVETDTVETDTVETDTVETDTVETDTVETDTVETDTVETDTVETDTVKTDTVETDTVKTDTVETDTVKTDTVETDTNTDSTVTKPATIKKTTHPARTGRRNKSKQK